MSVDTANLETTKKGKLMTCFICGYRHATEVYDYTNTYNNLSRFVGLCDTCESNLETVFAHAKSRFTYVQPIAD